MSAIKIDKLRAGYGTQAVLADVTLHVGTGDLVCVLGASGCGKTTLLRVIAGFERAWSGTVSVGARTLDDGRRSLPPERRRVGYVPQEGALFPHLTVADNVGFALARGDKTAGDRKARIAELLDLVDVSEHAARLPHQLSGGQQQRVAVARALASDPEVVLLDEPFASLDAALRARMREDIRAVLRSSGVTGLLVTHDRAEALSLGDQVAVIRDGRVVQAAAPREIYTQPADLKVARFVGDATIVEAEIERGLATTMLGTLRVDPSCSVKHGVARAVIRPEQFRLVAVPDDHALCESERVVLGTVTRAEYFGHDARVDVELAVAGGEQYISVVARVPGAAMPVETTQVAISIDQPIWVVAVA